MEIVKGSGMSKQQGILWLLGNAIRPVLAVTGIAAGPIAIASAAQTVIQWNGPYQFLLEFWSSNIRPPFVFLADWVSIQLGFSEVQDWLVDYLIVGLIYLSNYVRSASLTSQGGFIGAFVRTPWTAYFVFEYLFLWPIALVHQVWNIYIWLRDGVKINWRFLFLLYAPLFVFILMLLTNRFMN